MEVNVYLHHTLSSSGYEGHLAKGSIVHPCLLALPCYPTPVFCGLRKIKIALTVFILHHYVLSIKYSRDMNTSSRKKILATAK